MPRRPGRGRQSPRIHLRPGCGTGIAQQGSLRNRPGSLGTSRPVAGKEEAFMSAILDRIKPLAPTSLWRPSLGALLESGGTRFRVWAPEAGAIEVILERPGDGPRARPLEKF